MKRVRFGVKPNAKGICNMDVTVDVEVDREAERGSVVEVTGKLLKDAMKKFAEVVEEQGYKMVELSKD